MIIRLTVKDNDFTYVLSSYLSKIRKNILCDLSLICEELHEKEKKGIEIDTRAFINYYEESEKVNNILNPNIAKVLMDEDKEYLINRIDSSFKSYLQTYKLDKSTVLYLVNELKISFPKQFEDKWENGESVYWLQHSNNVITQ